MRRGERGPCRDPAGALRDETRIDVSHRLQGDGCAGEHESEGQAEQHRPDQVGVVGAGLLHPPEGGQPRRPRARHAGEIVARGARRVADAADQEHRHERPDRQGARASRGAQKLRREEADAEERDAAGRRCGPRQDRSCERKAGGDQRERREQGQGDVREDPVRDRRDRRKAAPGGGGPDELSPSCLLVAPGVPHGEECAHEGGEERQPRQHLESQERPFGRAGRQPAEHQDHRIRERGGEDVLPVGKSRVGLADTGVSGEGHQGRTDDPQRELQPIAAQSLSQQHAERGHHARSFSARRAEGTSCSASPSSAASRPARSSP